MGNRAVITTSKNPDVQNAHDLGIYLHWNGGRDSVEAFLTYCKLRNFRPPETDCYGWARLCQIIGNYFGGDLSIGIDQCRNLDCDNYDNGVYVIENWKIIDRKYNHGEEQNNHDLLEMLLDIDQEQPPKDRLGEEAITKTIREKQNTTLWVCVYADTTGLPEDEYFERTNLCYVAFPRKIVEGYYREYIADLRPEEDFETWITSVYDADDTEHLCEYAALNGYTPDREEIDLFY